MRGPESRWLGPVEQRVAGPLEGADGIWEGPQRPAGLGEPRRVVGFFSLTLPVPEAGGDHDGSLHEPRIRGKDEIGQTGLGWDEFDAEPQGLDQQLVQRLPLLLRAAADHAVAVAAHPRIDLILD